MTVQPLSEGLLGAYGPWLRRVASGMLASRPDDQPDLVQEGYIAMWRACQSWQEGSAPLDYWLKRAATQRMLTCVDRAHWTGQAKRSPGGRPTSRDLSLAEAGIEGYELDVEDLSSALAIEKALLGYHAGDVGRALALLTPRERRYVVLRFWHGMPGSQTDLYFGTHSANIWVTARPKLRSALGHLAGLVSSSA